MKRFRVAAAAVAVLGTSVAVPVAASAQDSARCPWVTSKAPVGQRVSQLMAAMSVADKISMVEGHGPANPYVFYTPAIPSLCVPAVGLEDGPAGAADKLTGVTQLPAGVALAASWDPGLARRYGAVIGAEEAGKGASANLGPTVNIDRDPRWGRSFESMSEDPYLTRRLAVPEIGGIQAQGVEDQVKHYAVYNQETYRNTPADDARIGDRALHEIYLPAFHDAVTKGHAASVMCAYSFINTHAACGDPYLETTVLREAWDFPGFVMSDYAAVHGTDGAAAGTDQEQPENTYFGDALRSAIGTGKVPAAVLNTMVQRVLTEMFGFGLLDKARGGSVSATVTTPAHRAVANQVAEAGTVLLKNARATLPLARGAGSVAVIGPSASASATYGGGGSAYVIPSSTVSPLQGIKAAGQHVTYARGLPADTDLKAIGAGSLSPAYPPGGTPAGGGYTGTLTAPETGTYVLGLTNPCDCYTPSSLSVGGKRLIDNPGTPPVSTYSAAVRLVKGQKYPLSVSGQSSRLLWAPPSALAPGIARAVAAAKSARTAVVVVSDDTESEAADRPGLNLPSAQDELVEAVAAANPRTVVVVNAGAPVAMPWLRRVAAVVDAWYPGQTSGTALASVLFGQTDPGGHLPVTFPASLGQVPAAASARWPGRGAGGVDYSEGAEVGYRWYDARGTAPLFPFGYGLSYTSFRFGDLRVSGPAAGTGDGRVTATITNTGSRTGSDVCQLYIGDPAASGEPRRQLEGFRRVTVAPGQSAPVSFTLTPAQLSWWSERANGWAESSGRYRVYVGDSSALADLPLRGSFTIRATPGDRQVSVHAPSSVTAGRPARVTVTLGAGGNETLPAARLAPQVPPGWTAVPDGPASFGPVAPGRAVTAAFTVTPPADAPNADAVVHATATMGAATRENGVTVTVTR